MTGYLFFVVAFHGKVILLSKFEKIPLVKEFNVNFRKSFLHFANLHVFLGYVSLLHCGEFDEQILIRKEEVGSECFNDISFLVPLQYKSARFIHPRDRVIIENLGTFLFAAVGELRRGVSHVVCELGFGFTHALKLYQRGQPALKKHLRV
jgi:hypothetical protein